MYQSLNTTSLNRSSIVGITFRQFPRDLKLRFHRLRKITVAVNFISMMFEFPFIAFCLS